MYKTFGVLDLAGSVIMKKSFAGRKVLRQGGVLFIAAEGVSELKKRLAGLFEKRYATQAPQAFVWVAECPNLHVNKKSLDILTATAKAAQHGLKARFNVDLALIVVDTLAAAAGFENENDAAQTQGVMTILQKLSAATGALCLAVDHFGKTEESGTRGSSAKEASADTSFWPSSANGQTMGRSATPGWRFESCAEGGAGMIFRSRLGRSTSVLIEMGSR